MNNRINKIIVFITILAIMISAVSGFAKTYRVGDVIGYALTTDIAATINGYDIPSYNVDGYTYIVAEDLRYYGFSVNYDAFSRSLSVARDYSQSEVTKSYTKPYVSPNRVGQRAHALLYTDIKTYLDGSYTQSYNIDGLTIIRFDALNVYGDVWYDNDIRVISLSISGLNAANSQVVDVPAFSIMEEMTAEERRELNLFLSNFSEAHYTHGSKEYITSIDEEKISFAHSHAFINRTGQDFYTEDYRYMGISAADVDKILNRFFGESVPHRTPENSQYWFYKDGNFLMPSASGEAYAYFTIADGVYLNADGTYTVEFNVYFDSEEGCCSEITDKSVYSLTAQYVEKHERFQFCESGIATVIPKVRNGENTYELVDYCLMDNAQ